MKRIVIVMVTLVVIVGVSVAAPDTSTRPMNGSGMVVGASWGSREIVSFAIERGIDVNGFYRYENSLSTALIAAADGGHLEVVRMLIDSGACLDSRDSRHWSALMYAADGGHANVVEVLLEAGAHRGLKTPNEGMTADELAEANGFYQIAALIQSTES